MQTSTSKSSKSPSTGSGHATSMADLLNRSKTNIVNVQKGQTVKGVITKLTSGEILLDINSKTEAVVLEKERRIMNKILSAFKVGDTVFATVLNPESDNGNTVVSLRRSIDDMVWEKLDALKKKQEPIEVTLNSATKGGYLVSTIDGTSGFLPNSHISTLENPQNLIGKNIKVIILELNRSLRKIIFSQKQVMGMKDFDKLIKGFKPNQKIEVTISSITPFGIFVSVMGPNNQSIEGLIHISEISWESIESIPEGFKVGQKLEALIIGFDKDSRRINLSIKKLSVDPLEKKLEEFPIDKKVLGTVVKIISSGVLLDLGEGITGMIKKEKIPVSMSYKEGMEVEATVSSIDKKRHRVILTPVLKEKPIGYR